MNVKSTPKRTFIVEHLDPELEAWQALEYNAIAEECAASDAKFLLTGVADQTKFDKRFNVPKESLEAQGVELLYPNEEQKRQVCLLDPKGDKDLSPEDGEQFNVFLFGGILGDDPPRDRTSELRRLGFSGRRLGPEQMTTDTAVRVTRIVVQDKKRLDQILFVDRPDINLPGLGDRTNEGNLTESVSMPFKYVKGEDGEPVMPKGMLELLASDADKGILDLL